MIIENEGGSVEGYIWELEIPKDWNIDFIISPRQELRGFPTCPKSVRCRHRDADFFDYETMIKALNTLKQSEYDICVSLGSDCMTCIVARLLERYCLDGNHEFQDPTKPRLHILKFPPEEEEEDEE